ncbi:serine/threonine-protein kinase [Streptomyces sp. NPDC050263]|uniref:serine/threonine-protein kinase n=1 Tax=Streptomyces sp. NPDC050263 TaxID=3155037 RepID=UPI0034292ABF
MHSQLLGLSGYEVLEVLGQGGFATVYRARQLSVGREVALKVDSRVLAGARDRQRFLREVTAAGQLSGHPNVVAVYDAGILADGRPYMVLELCPGGSLGDRLYKQGAFPVEEARSIGVRIADALAAAHAAGVLHRDIKPGNIMVNQYGEVALADFGLAAMPRPGQELSVTREALTPAYAPPEAFRLAEPTPAGDVYSLGATVYALLHGRPAHAPEQGSLSLAEVIVRHTWPLPDVPGVPPALMAVLRRAMAADPADRLPSAEALRDALAAADLHAPHSTSSATGLPATPAASVSVSPPTVVGGEQRGGRRRSAVLVLAATAALAVVGATAVLADGSGSATTGSARGSAGSTTPGASRSAVPSSAATDFRVTTTTKDCPAAAVPGADARCTETAECWGGIVAIVGMVTVNRSDCFVEHPWETFAIAPLPADGMTIDQRELARHPTVRQLCSRDVLAKSRLGRARDIALADWTIEIVPPSQMSYADGLRVYRCVATVVGKESTEAYFRPRS